ncbi:hypothetical protein DdX_02073 [Ditylenchus destructor]|uniref:Uncharacterized protein n=1 Tax=Ditylenchus destructor TaxID=166010 RepID=A0AAD4R8T2_9BILA|nr:hypothetical protein DdX_02073 [Ditylenchus destructor]
MGVVPIWAWYAFVTCFILIVIFLLLDYLVIRRNALGNTCVTMGKRRKGTGTLGSSIPADMPHAFHHKKSTNVVLHV